MQPPCTLCISQDTHWDTTSYSHCYHQNPQDDHVYPHYLFHAKLPLLFLYHSLQKQPKRGLQKGLSGHHYSQVLGTQPLQQKQPQSSPNDSLQRISLRIRMTQNSFCQKPRCELHFVALLAYIAGGLVSLVYSSCPKAGPKYKNWVGGDKGEEWVSLTFEGIFSEVPFQWKWVLHFHVNITSWFAPGLSCRVLYPENKSLSSL